MQYFYHLKLNAQTELSILQNQPAGESGFLEHVYHHDKHLDHIISRNNTMGFVAALIPSVLVTVSLVYLIIIPEISSLEKCTSLICLTLLTCVIIISSILYQLHSEKIVLERNLGYKIYSLERKKVDSLNRESDRVTSDLKSSVSNAESE